MVVRMVSLTIDGRMVTVPAGTLVVDAAKKAGVDIPVFCYHPKLDPVGMCRQCLVEIGRPLLDRATNEFVLDADGKPKISFGAKLETACTTPVSEGMVVVTDSEKVAAARKDVLEFLLTSHPLDCPVCDKGGECPLQNLTLRYGPAVSRFQFDEKMHLAKHVPLGELIYLDRERCIQCGRCVRFQSELVDDPVIGFSQRGRALQIVTFSNPGFDSIWSGNTTDICPVGALTTADFRFGARPWELKAAASICNHCAVGCNLTYNVRREAKAGGKTVIKRVMPRQNEMVNEIWLCDKGRLVYHYMESPQRLERPLVRKGSELVPADWDEALTLVAEKVRGAGSHMVMLAGGRLSNEDLFNLGELTETQGGQKLLYSYIGGGDLVSRFAPPKGSNLGELGAGSVVMVVACDLHQEAPLWWLRLKQAVKRGAKLIVVNARPTRLDKFAVHVIRYAYGEEARTVAAFLPANVASAPQEVQKAAEILTEAEDLLVIYGSDGLCLEESTVLARSCAELLLKTNHTGKVNSGLLAAWQNGNLQGGWELGFRTAPDLAERLEKAALVWIAAADPAGDDPALAKAVRRTGFLVVQELFLTETARIADVVLPVLANAEREGSYTSGERRVQRFYPALPPNGVVADARPDFTIPALVGEKLGIALEGRSAALVMEQIAAKFAAFAGITYQKLAEVVEQWPPVGGSDLYYGGTSYENRQGLGVMLSDVLQGESLLNSALVQTAQRPKPSAGALPVYPIQRLYDRGTTVMPSALLHERLALPAVWVHPATAAERNLQSKARLIYEDEAVEVSVQLDEQTPPGVALLPRSVGLLGYWLEA